MISASEARRLGIDIVNKQIDKVDNLIRNEAISTTELTLAVFPYNKVLKKWMDQIWPDFKGLHPDTVKKLEEYDHTVEIKITGIQKIWIIRW